MEIAGIDVPLWTILATLAAVLGYIYTTWNFDTWSKQGVKGAKPWPLFGNLISALKSGGFTFYDLQLTKTYGKISGSFRGSVPILDVADPEFLRLAMVKNFSSMPNRQDKYMGDRMLDNFMTALVDDHWRHVRSSLSPTFTSGKLKQMKARIDDCADTFVEHIGETNGEPFDSKKFTGGYTMDVISTTAFGVQIDSQRDPNHPMLLAASTAMGTGKVEGIYKRIRSIFMIIIFLMAPLFLQRWLNKLGVGFVDQEAMQYFQDITSKIISDRGLEETKEKDFVQLCVDKLVETPSASDPDTKVNKYGTAWSGKGLTKDEIVANAIFFFFAGFETTASTMNYVLYELTMNKDVQEKLYEEIMEHISSDVATYDELSKMEYLDWVIQESMRMYPATPRVERLVDRETTVEGIRLPAGSMVSAMIYAIHHNPEIWPEPNKFDPERFSPENLETRHQYAWIPFGLGNRNCIGMRLALLEMKIAVVKIVSNFFLEPCEGTPEKPMKFAKNFRMDPEKPIQITARPRKTVSDE